MSADSRENAQVMKLDVRIAERLGVIDGTLKIRRVFDCTYMPANPSGKAVEFSYRHDAGHSVIPATDCAPLECFEGNDPAGYVTRLLAILGSHEVTKDRGPGECVPLSRPKSAGSLSSTTTPLGGLHDGHTSPGRGRRGPAGAHAQARLPVPRRSCARRPQYWGRGWLMAYGGPSPADAGQLAADLARFMTPPATRQECDALWDRVCSGGAPDPSPYGMGFDHCPWCGEDWRQPHGKRCPSPYAT